MAREGNGCIFLSQTIVGCSKHNNTYPLFCISQIVLGLILIMQSKYSSFCLIDIFSYKVVTTDIVHHKTLLRIHMEIKNQHLSRSIASNQVLTIPLNSIRFCISTTKLKNLFTSDCILDIRWTTSLP